MVLLSMLFIIPFFSLSTYADDQVPFFQVHIQASDDGETWSTGNWIQPEGLIFPNTGKKYWRIDAFRIFYADLMPSDLWISFQAGCLFEVNTLSNNSTITYPNYFPNKWSQYENNNKPGSVYASPNSSTISTNCSWFCNVMRGTVPTYSTYSDLFTFGAQFITINIRIKPNLSYTADSNAQSIFRLDGPLVLSNYDGTSNIHSDNILIHPFFYKCSFFQNTASFLNSVLSQTNSKLDLIQTTLSAQNPYLSSIQQNTVNVSTNLAELLDYSRALNANSGYSWLSHFVSNTGHISISQQTGSWYDAIIGSLNTLTSDFALQIEMQNQAVSGGAETALTQAWGAIGSSLSDVTSILDIGNISAWNYTAFSTAGDSAFGKWFSQQNLDSIDNVPELRNEEQIVDYYSINVQSILDLLGGDE